MDIKSRFTGSVLFTAEIDCDKDKPMSWKLRMAVEWAIKNSADLRSADLSYANLRSANLSSADLRSADLSSANLSSADLSYADLSYANLRYADLSSADLRSANLSSANLRSADLSYADLSSADLRSANLSSANIKAVAFTGCGKENRAGYAIVDGKEIKVRLGCFYDTEKAALTAIRKKYGRNSAYEMIVKGACKQLKENMK